MDTLNDVHMSNGKQYISKEIKVNSWLKNVGNELEGLCYYCNCRILIPKVVKEKLFPGLNLDDYDSQISNPIFGTHFDHIISEYNNGYTKEDNIRPICIECNLKKGNKNDEDFVVTEKKKENEIDFMDIDVKNELCNGLKFKNGISCSCQKKSYFRNKCINHLHQKTKY